MFGLKPAKILALIYRHGAVVNRWSREELKKASKNVTETGPDGWLYFACKRVQHGTNYLLQPATMSGQILEDSYKKLGTPIIVPKKECERLQHFYLSRYYGVPYWQSKVKQLIIKDKALPCASGHVRRFFGKPDDPDTQRKAVAHCPQANTTYATNKAILNLWNDRENVVGGNYRIQPLHQMHDAVIGQFRFDDLDFARRKIPQYFNNPLVIAGTTLVIPYGGGYGLSWKDTETPFEEDYKLP
jgi:hypothetical protein